MILYRLSEPVQQWREHDFELASKLTKSQIDEVIRIMVEWKPGMKHPI
ncbi:MAG: hypothetical protein ORO03_01055 [Alphaproteobacteria bacterium]|nr:hypothetical protein [Alphaproteobacteria bacterium]